MPRPSQLLHAQREPVATRPAATVLLLRDGVNGVEVLMTRRSMTASFAPGAYVFPGGVVDALDAAAHAQARHRATQSDLHLTQAIAAIRESFEELGVLFARRADGTMADATDIAALDRKQPFIAQCAVRGLVLAADEVFVLAHWITDRDLPRRFDVPFLVARMPEGQSPVADESEQFEPVWVRPADALHRHKDGNFFIIFPTIRTLERLQAFATVADVLKACAATEQPLWTSCPRGGFLQGREERFMEHEQAQGFGELELVSPDGQMVHTLDWGTNAPVRLLKNVIRVTAPNPGAMTGPGTNSYLVGDPHTGYIAIDPGPNEPEHIERLWQAAGGDIRLIVCTHSHPDHSPGAKPLQALCRNSQNPVRAEPVEVPGRASTLRQGQDRPGSARTVFPQIVGLPSAPTANEQSQFVPDRALLDQELLAVSGTGHNGADAGIGHTLKVVFTPGHAANHLCLVLLEDGLLFSGDHVLNGSTTVVNPPDGEMTAYLESLDLLTAACKQHDIHFILPAHGYVLGDARGAIAQLKAHRLKREAKIFKVMQADPNGSMDDWVKLAYDDVPTRLWPVAKRSMLAHVQRLQAMM